MQVILFYLCIGRDPHKIDFAVVNNETMPSENGVQGSLLFIGEMCNKTFDLVGNVVFGGRGSSFYINNFENKTTLIITTTTKKHYMNWSDAYRETKLGHIWGFISFNQNFTQDTIAK